MCHKILLVGLVLFTLLLELVTSTTKATKGNDRLINVYIRMKTYSRDTKNKQLLNLFSF